MRNYVRQKYIETLACETPIYSRVMTEESTVVDAGRCVPKPTFRETLKGRIQMITDEKTPNLDTMVIMKKITFPFLYRQFILRAQFIIRGALSFPFVFTRKSFRHTRSTKGKLFIQLSPIHIGILLSGMT